MNYPVLSPRVSATKIIGEINELYEGIASIPFERDLLIERIHLVTTAWKKNFDDQELKIKLSDISKKLILSIKRIDEFEHILPLLIVAHNEIMAHTDFNLFNYIIKALQCCRSSKNRKLENVTKFYAVLRSILERRMIKVDDCSKMFSFFNHVLDIVPVDYELARSIASLNPKILHSGPHQNSTLGLLFEACVAFSTMQLEVVRFLLELNADLSEMIHCVACDIKTEVPIIVKAALDHNIPFFNLVIPYVQPEHTLLTDSLGLTTYYYMMLAPEDYPEAVKLLFRHRSDGLPPEILFYLEGVYRERILTEEQHGSNFERFIDVWRHHKTPENVKALVQATLALLLRYPRLYPSSNLEHFIELIGNVLPFAPHSGYLMRNIIMALYSTNSMNQKQVDALIVRVIDGLDPNIIILDPIGIIQRSQVYFPQNLAIIDALFRHQADDLIHQCALKGQIGDLTYLHFKGGVMKYSTLKVFLFVWKEMLRLVLDYSDEYRSLVDAALYIDAQKKGRYDIANILFEVFGDKLITDLHSHFDYLKRRHLGLDRKAFSRLISSEIKSMLSRSTIWTPTKPYIFDENFLQRISEEFLAFWDDQVPPYDSFDIRLQAFPYKGLINFLQSQKQVWDLFQNDSRTAGFPARAIWRFAIDADEQIVGPCAFEHEPGYLNSFLRGMAFALATAGVPKTADWYIELHTKIVEECEFPELRGAISAQHLEKWNGAQQSFQPYIKEIRTKLVRWEITYLDQDPIGMSDLRTNRFWKLKDNVMVCDIKSDVKDAEYRQRYQLETVMNHYNQVLENAENRALKIVIALGFARELELHHYFNDGNGRSSYLTFISLITGMKEIPYCLFPDPNVFDANGPESLAYRYIEGCLNFRAHGLYLGFKRSNGLKQLSEMNLSNYPDLEILRDELMPIVCGKKWQEVMPMMPNILKNTQKQTFECSSENIR